MDLKICVIKEEDGKFCLYSKDGKKKLGTFDTKEEAMAREKQIQKFASLRANKKGDVTTGMFQGREHMIVPVTALVEGVIHASNADNPELVLAEEFERNVQTWNGRPVMLNHPVVGDAHVSAGDPKILEQYQIGTVFNARVEDRELRMDAYLDVEKMEKMGGEAAKMLAAIRAGDTTEVSVGTFVEAEPRSGKLGDKLFKAVWREIATDHLAFLPEGVTGACSIEMGCGAQRAAAVYESSSRAASCGCGGSGSTHASAEDGSMDKKARVAAIIASGKTCFKTADAAVLEQLSDEAIKALEAKIAETPVPVETKVETPEEFLARNPQIKSVVDSAKAEAAKTAEQREEEFLKANPAIGSIVSEHKAARAAKTADLVGKLKAAQKAYTEEELKALPLETLEKLAQISLTEKKDFSGAGPSRAASSQDEEVPKAIDMKARVLAMHGKGKS